MITISYTESLFLKQSLRRIDVLRQRILMCVIAPEKELQLRWQTTIERLYWSLSMSNSELSKADLSKLLKDPLSKPFSFEQQEALSYKNGFDYIVQYWLSSQKSVALKDVIALNQKVSGEKLNIKADSLTNSLSYFQNSNEHPLIQAGLVYYQIYALSPTNNRNVRFSSLLSYLFLYKEGFDFRGFLVFEEYLRKNYTDYQLLLAQAQETGAQTLWLEFFAKAVQSSLLKALETINSERAGGEAITQVTNLNERQKEILSLLENPDATITNRQVQKLFKISQITASRDLAKLASLLLIFSHGKGRSVYYTRV